MQTLPTRHRLAVGLALAALLAATRGYHAPTIVQALPSASWAAFFLAGVYLRPAWALAALLGLAAFLDYAAIAWGGVNSFCVSPAYVGLIPAYGTLWFAGRVYAARHASRITTLWALAASVALGTLACELISSGSFYFFSGRFAQPTLAEFAGRLLEYLPHDLGAMLFWVTFAAIVHAAIIAVRRDTAGANPV